MKNDLLPCLKCQSAVVAQGGPEEWIPTFYDPDRGGEPYVIGCECGLCFSIGSVDYSEFFAAWNTRPEPEPRALKLGETGGSKQMSIITLGKNRGEIYRNGELIHNEKYWDMMMQGFEAVFDETETLERESDGSRQPKGE